MIRKKTNSGKSVRAGKPERKTMNPDTALYYLDYAFMVSLGILGITFVLTTFLFFRFRIPEIFAFRSHMGDRKRKKSDTKKTEMREYLSGNRSRTEPAMFRKETGEGRSGYLSGNRGRTEPAMFRKDMGEETSGFRFEITQDIVVVHTEEIVAWMGKEER